MKQFPIYLFCAHFKNRIARAIAAGLFNLNLITKQVENLLWIMLNYKLKWIHHQVFKYGNWNLSLKKIIWHHCQNQFQVTQQVSMEGTYKNRYDVTFLVNGLPLVQIERKRQGLELKVAFNQTNRYHRHSYGTSNGLFLISSYLLSAMALIPNITLIIHTSHSNKLSTKVITQILIIGYGISSAIIKLYGISVVKYLRYFSFIKRE